MKVSFPKDTSYLFKRDRFLDSKGHLRALLVFKKTRWELFQEENIPSLNKAEAIELQDMQRGHQEHLSCLKKVREILKKHNVSVVECFRAEISKDLINNRVLITVGGDGTLLDLAQYTEDNPIFSVNSDPDRSVGSLCIANIDNFELLFLKLLNQELLVQKVIRIEAFLDGKKLKNQAVNEVLITHENPAAKSRYSLAVDGVFEFQKSSGIWIGAPAGSSGALVSAGGKVQPIYDQNIQFVVREPYFSRQSSPRFLKMQIAADKKIVIISHMHDGQVYIDGHMQKIPFGLNSQLELSGTGSCLHFFITEEMEKRRQEIGRCREDFHHNNCL